MEQQAPNFQTGGFDYRKLLKALRRFLWLIVVLPVVLLLAALLYLRYTVPVFEGSLTLQLSVQENSAVSDLVSGGRQDPIVGASANLSPQIELLKSRDMICTVVDTLRLYDQCFKKGLVIESELYDQAKPFELAYDIEQLTSAVTFHIRVPEDNPDRLLVSQSDEEYVPYTPGPPLSSVIKGAEAFKGIKITSFKPAVGDYRIQILPQNTWISQVSSKLEITHNVKASSLRLVYQDKVPERSSDILSTLVDIYLSEELEQSKLSYRQKLSFIDSLMSTIRTQLDSAEFDLQSFETENAIPVFDANRAFELQKYALSRQKILELQQEQKTLRELRSYMKEKFSQSNYDTLRFAPSSSIITDPVLVTLINNLNEEISQLKDLATRLKPTSAVYKLQLKKVDELLKTVYESLGQREQDVGKQIRLSEARIANVKGSSRDFPETERSLTRVQTSYENTFDLYQSLVDRRTTTQLAMAAIVSNSRVIDKAYVPDEPVSPKKNIIIRGALVGGLLLAIAFALIVHFTKSTFTTYGELAELTKVPIIGQTLEYQQNYTSTPLVVLDDNRSFMTETFRKLRSNLQFILENDKRDRAHTITVTSTVPKEGKTFFSLNLAGILSLLGEPVVVVDLDLRKPRQHIYMKLNSDSGVTTYLLGKDELDDIIQTSAYHNLDIITTGPAPPNPGELIVRPELKAMVSELQKRYKYVILDTSPIGLVTDALPLFQLSDVNLYMVRAERSKRAFVKNIDNLKNSFDIDNLYIVFNGVKSRKHLSEQGGGQYGYGYYGHGYGGYVYGVSQSEAASYYLTSDEEPKWWEFWKRFKR